MSKVKVCLNRQLYEHRPSKKLWGNHLKIIYKKQGQKTESTDLKSKKTLL